MSLDRKKYYKQTDSKQTHFILSQSRFNFFCHVFCLWKEHYNRDTIAIKYDKNFIQRHSNVIFWSDKMTIDTVQTKTIHAISNLAGSGKTADEINGKSTFFSVSYFFCFNINFFSIKLNFQMITSITPVTRLVRGRM